MKSEMTERFSLTGRVIVVTGGAGLLGRMHGEAIAEASGIPVLLDLDQASVESAARDIAAKTGARARGLVCDIASKAKVEATLKVVLADFGRVDGLVNNAANDPKVGKGAAANRFTRFENLTEAAWSADLAVGLTGSFLCAQVFGHHLATHGGGVILNIASDLAVIAPDQRLYAVDGQAPENQPVKPVTYSVVKTGLIGLTRYLATYWADAGVRVNAISPGGVFNGQGDEFVGRIAQRIPLGRMAKADEYKASVVYLLSDASSYMTGANVVVDGGRSVW